MSTSKKSPKKPVKKADTGAWIVAKSSSVSFPEVVDTRVMSKEARSVN